MTDKQILDKYYRDGVIHLFERAKTEIQIKVMLDKKLRTYYDAGSAIKLKYGFYDGYARSDVAIAQILCCTEERVRQIYETTWRKLTHSSSKKELWPYITKED